MTMLIFFSSRRRHTRWPRDWSSDVCSSDLDRLDDESREALLYQEDGVAVSATDRESLHVLLEAIDQFLVAKIGRASCRERVESAVEGGLGERYNRGRGALLPAM